MPRRKCLQFQWKMFTVSMEHFQMTIACQPKKKKHIVPQSPVPMTIYYTRQRLSFRTDNRNVMTALKNITPTVFYLHNNNITLERSWPCRLSTKIDRVWLDWKNAYDGGLTVNQQEKKFKLEYHIQTLYVWKLPSILHKINNLTI